MRIKNHEYYAEMVHRSVDVGQKIKDWMDEYTKTTFKELQKMQRAGASQQELVRIGQEKFRKFKRRSNALIKVKIIQARAYKIAYGVDAPTIEGIG